MYNVVNAGGPISSEKHLEVSSLYPHRPRQAPREPQINGAIQTECVSYCIVIMAW